MIVVADTSPICYLLLINCIDVLPQLYGQVLIPQTVRQELTESGAPAIIRDWINQPPAWLIIQTVMPVAVDDLDNLDPGERATIMLAEQQGADLILIDDRLGRQVALSRGLNITGLLGVLGEAARQNLVDFPDVMTRLAQTTF